MHPSIEGVEREERIDEIVAEFLDAVEEGRRPELTDLLSQYPDLADDLKRFFSDWAQFDQLASPLRCVATPARAHSMKQEPAALVDASVDADEEGSFKSTLSFDADSSPKPSSVPFPNIDGYEVLEEIGRGGMGLVYKARQTVLDRLVALKMMQAGAAATKQELARFRAEAQAVARLNHPNVVEIYDVDEWHGLPFFCVELVEGGNLKEKLGAAPIKARVAAGVLATLARAMHYAHEHGIVHRDLKPANVLLDAAPDTPIEECTPKITDFGLAKRLDSESMKTESGAIVGTPCYMSPEQASGGSKKVGPLADVYSLGAILYEMVTGRPPFTAATPLDTLLQVISAEVVAPSRLQPGCPKDLETICLKCLQKEPQKRYASAEALADDVERFLAGKPIQARPISVWERAAKWVRRKPAQAASIAFLLLAVVGVSVGGMLYFHQKEQITSDKLRDLRRIADVKDNAQDLYQQGRQALAEGRLDDAKRYLASALEVLRSEASLASFGQTIRRSLNEVETGLAYRKGQARVAKKMTVFERTPGDAFFHLNVAPLTGLDVPSSAATAGRIAERGLAMFQTSSGRNDDPAFEGPYKESEKRRIVAGCYQLRLIAAEAAAQNGELERALEILDRAHRKAPFPKIYHVRKARYLSLLGDKAKATIERAKAEACKPSGALDDFLVTLDEWKQAQDPQQARSTARAGLTRSLKSLGDSEPQYLFWARLLLANFHRQQRQHVQAVTYLTECIKERPDFIWPYLVRGFVSTQIGDDAFAQSDYKKAATLESDDLAKSVLYNNRAVLLIQKGELDEARRDLQAAIRLTPGLISAYLNLSQVWWNHKKWDMARETLTQAIDLKLKLTTEGERSLLDKEILTRLHRGRANVHLQVQDLKSALADFKQAIAHNPNPLSGYADHYECAFIHDRKGRYQEAVDTCNKALRLAGLAAIGNSGKLSAEMRNQVAACYRLQAEAYVALDNYKEALKCFDLYRKFGPDNVDVFRQRALIYVKLGNNAKAAVEYTLALDVEPDNAELLGRRGWLYVVANEHVRAMSDFARAIRLDPKSSDAHNGRGFARAKLGDHAGAADDARKAVRLWDAAEDKTGKQTNRTYYNAARAFAQAAAAAESQRQLRGAPARETVLAYQLEGAQRLAGALDALPTKEQAGFWHNVVLKDRDLDPIRGNRLFDSLAARFPKSTGPSAAR